MLGGVLMCLFGLLEIAVSGWASRQTAAWNERVFGRPFHAEGYRIALIVGGALFIGIGVLSIAGLIRFGP